MNTGVQRSSATPFGAWTTTTPAKRVKEQRKKDILSIMTAHAVPYAATATVAYPDDFLAKFARARAIRGTRFLHLLSPCPPGWKIPSDRAIEFARLAVQTGVFPLVEVENGESWRITVRPEPRPLEEYLAGQGRFRQVDAERIAVLKEEIAARLERITSRR
jgi:pyruvate ferredoxin oxidoreductase beta subunit/2-oxoisovalerate ferredoxin oxidoreductase beta subunit